MAYTPKTFELQGAAGREVVLFTDKNKHISKGWTIPVPPDINTTPGQDAGDDSYARGLYWSTQGDYTGSSQLEIEDSADEARAAGEWPDALSTDGNALQFDQSGLTLQLECNAPMLGHLLTVGRFTITRWTNGRQYRSLSQSVTSGNPVVLTMEDIGAGPTGSGLANYDGVGVVLRTIGGVPMKPFTGRAVVTPI